MKRYFEGWYYKHQNQSQTVVLIPGRADNTAFVQVITDRGSTYVPYPLSAYRRIPLGRGWDLITVGPNWFTPNGIWVNIAHKALRVTGHIAYSHLTPPAYDLMGWFRFLPMECYHGVISLHHRLLGALTINGKCYDFDGGTGYIEQDRGRSFPKQYLWVQTNDFKEKGCVMLSVATIPLGGLSFTGILASVWYRGVEYRLATYNGARVKVLNPKQVVVTCGPYRLEVELPGGADGHSLLAPQDGQMSRTIRERVAVPAQIRFFERDRRIFDQFSPKTGVELVL